jgi:predicted DNA binding protein
MRLVDACICLSEHVRLPTMATHHVRIEVRLPDGHWAGDVTRANPNDVLRIEETMPLGRGRGTARIAGTAHLFSSIRDHEKIDDLRELDVSHATVEISAGGGGFLRPLMEVGVIPHTPFDVRDGWVEWTLECTQGKVRSLIERFRDQAIPHRLLSTRTTSSHLLTQRQHQVYELALREGYYDMPRRTTITTLADMLGVAKSTLSAQMHRIESTVMHTFAEEIRRRNG